MKAARFFAVVLAIAVLVGCRGESGKGRLIKLVGSTSVGPVAEKLTEAYMAKTPDIEVEIEQVGSSAGIEAVKRGTADIGMSSRELTSAEKDDGLLSFDIAIDAMAVIVHPDNPVTGLSSGEIRSIFLGELVNWNQVGGDDAGIIVVSRESGSGTRDAFESIMGVQADKNGKKVSALVPTALVAEGTGSIKASVATKKYAVGYISLGYVDGSVRACDIDGVKALEANVKNKSYVLARPFLLVTKGQPGDEAHRLISWIRADGQEIVKDNKYIAID